MSETQRIAVEKFRTLHAEGCFVLPNPWDVGSAVYLQHVGFKALATTSSGFAFSKGLLDETPSVDDVLAHCRDIAQATPLPVNADFRHGYADDPAGVAANVTRCVATGVAGLSIEDSTGNNAEPLYDIQLAVERIKAARQAIDASGIPVVLTGRCEAFLTRDRNAFIVSLQRLKAYAEAGADCLYAPGVIDLSQIEEIVREISPKPVNVLVSRPDPNLTVAKLADLGVRRISVGSALARVAWGSFMRSAQSIATTGTFDSLGEGAAFAELTEVFKR
ncbi:MAG TPA: isocitrate lyase/phosphoenolpyruvate mutase family protein [Pyrinomonadaceae bacterium]|nr:isocitrate lyase/phosphoenolpyruvate mutase family protein [Pyrinomonadaceae bacterium]